MALMIDTGVLLRAFDASSPEYRTIRQALRTIWSRQESLVVALQNLAEFWNVSTRPTDRNGYGLSFERVAKRLSTIESICGVLIEDDRTFEIWKGLLATNTISGVAVHDARLASIMLANSITTIVTLNAQDFRRYQGITVVLPSEI
jgi:predicted nucleic acid-binding protein